MKNGTYCLLLLLLSLGSQVNGQIQLEDRVVVYHQDGSVFIGELVYEDAQQLVMILSTTDTISVNKSFARKIKQTPKDIIIHRKGKYHYIKGFFATLTYGTAISNEFSQQADLILGMRLNKKYSIGLGVGAHAHATVFSGLDNNQFQGFNGLNWIQNDFIPVYVYGRYYPWDFKIRPFADMKIGYGLPNINMWNNEHSGGAYFQPGIGIHFSSRKNFRWTLALSQSFQNTKGDNVNVDFFSNEILYNYNIWYSRTVLTVGFEFH